MMEESRRLALIQHAQMRARLRHAERRGRVLEAAGLDEATWSEEDAAWTAHIESSIRRGEIEEVSAWQQQFAATKSELEEAAEERRLAAIDEKPAPSAPVSAPAPVQQVASFMYPRAEASFAPPPQAQPRMAGLGVSLQPNVAVVPPSAPARMGMTLNAVDAGQSGRPVPFAPGGFTAPVAAPPVPAPHAPTGTILAEDGPGEPVLPFMLVEEGVSLERYAAVSAELAAAPSHRTDVLRRHGFADEIAFERVRAAWKRRMSDAAISGRFMGMFVRFREDLQKSK